MALWLVRAGSKGERETFAIENNCVVIAWDDCPDLSSFTSAEAMEKMYRSMRPNHSEGYIRNHARQLWAFAKRIQKGDLIALPLKHQDAIAFGRASGEYKFVPNNPSGAKHVRPVDWITTELPRDRLDQDLLYSLGAFLTVCQIKRNNAEQRIEAILAGRSAPAPVISHDVDDEDEATESTAPPDLDEYASTQIRTHITQKFAGHAFADIIDAILQAQGYQTDKSPPGPDGGVDIIAGRGPLGFDPPRICVQVKATGSPQDIKELRELKGVMKDFNADQGLFVSWSGFKRSVLSESKRHYFEIRLWDANDVISAIQRYYDQFPDALKAELPLKRIWTLVQEETAE